MPYPFFVDYKTRRCGSVVGHCALGARCLDFHDVTESRRNPLEFRYLCTPCASVCQDFGRGLWRSPRLCPHGDKCTYAHTALEIIYHPHVYKTTRCAKHSIQECGWGDLCPHAHTEKELWPLFSPARPVTSQTAPTLQTPQKAQMGRPVVAHNANVNGLGAQMVRLSLAAPKHVASPSPPARQPPLPPPKPVESPSSLSASERLERLLCPICLDADKDMICVPCGHSFCSTCIHQHQAQNSQDCPMCQTKVDRLQTMFL